MAHKPNATDALRGGVAAALVINNFKSVIICSLYLEFYYFRFVVAKMKSIIIFLLHRNRMFV